MATRHATRRSFIETARREQIVTAAVTTLAELGFADTSLGKIARTAGLSSVGMISYYFAGKAELMAEVESTVLAAAGEVVAPRVAAAGGAVDRFAVYVRASLEWVAEHRAEAVALIEITLASRRPRTEGAVESGAIAVVADLAGKARAEAGSAPDPDADRVLAVAVRGAIDRAVAESLRRHPEPGGDPGLAADGERMAALFLRAL